MRTFSHKPESHRKSKSTPPAKTASVFFGQSREGSSILHLQRTIGNQSVQRLQGNAEEFEAGSTTTASTCFVHDFSQIPLQAKAHAEVQPKLTVSTPGGISEQEAGQVADQEEPFLQCKGIDSPDSMSSSVESMVSDVRNGGTPIPVGDRRFFEPRFGRSFSEVRIHTDARANAASRAIGARAFTLGRHIAFRTGEFQSGTTAGRWLMAHELTHTIQQGQTKYQNSSNIVQRDIPRRPRLSDPQVASATSLGAMVRLTFNMTWTRDEIVAYLWPNGPNPPVNFFMPDEADPWKTGAGEYQRFLILPNSFVLRGIRQNVHRMIYESIPVFNAQDILPDWIPDEIRVRIQEAFTSEEDIHLFGRWPEQDGEYTQGLYWMRRRGRRTQIEVAQLPAPSAVRDRRLREARITVNQYITSYVLSEGLSISEAKARTRERTRRELVIEILEAIRIVIPGRIPSLLVPRLRPSIRLPRGRRPPRVTPLPGRHRPTPTRLGGLFERAREMVRRIRQAGGEVVANMGGAGASHEPPGAININSQAVGRRGIPNHINADASDIGQLFEAGSIDRVVGHHMPPHVIDWQRAVPGVRSVLRPGGTFRFDWRGATPEAAQVERLLQEAGFLNIQNFLNAAVTATRS